MLCWTTTADSMTNQKSDSFISPIHAAFSTLDEKLGDALFFHQNTIFWKHAKLNAKTCHSILALMTDQCKAHIGPATLAKNWGIGISFTKRTIDAMTQCGLHRILHPTLSCCFHTNGRQLCYRRIGHDIFTDTLEAWTTTWF